MELKVGQHFRLTSAIAKGYEKLEGEFSFVVKVIKLYRTTVTPMVATDGDVTFQLVEWEPMNGHRIDPWFAVYSLALGYEQYGQVQMKVPQEEVVRLNWSPNFIDGEGEWYVPNIFKRQDLFLYLVFHSVAKYLPDYQSSVEVRSQT